MLVSVIMPVFNEEKFIADAIESMLHQTYSNWELIIVDDNSSDNTMKVAATYAQQDARITTLKNLSKGKVAAFNTGFSMASGQYLHLFAGDDIMVPECLERCYVAAQESQSAAVYHDMILVKEDLSPIRSFKMGKKFAEISIDKLVAKSMSIPSGAWFFHQSISELVWPIPEDIPYEDKWLTICFKVQEQIYYLSEALYKYRQHDAQTFGRLDDISWYRVMYRFRRDVRVIEHLLNSEIRQQLSEQTVDLLLDKLNFYQLLERSKSTFSELVTSDLSIKRKTIVLLAWYTPGLLACMMRLQRRMESYIQKS